MQTIEERLEQLELQNQRMERQSQGIERKNRRLTAALAVMAVTICAVVTMAATGGKDGKFDTVTARHIVVKNDAGQIVVMLDANTVGGGLIATKSAQDNFMLVLGNDTDGGMMQVKNKTGEKVIQLYVDDKGGLINVNNKTGEGIVQIKADEYGNGVVGAYNRKGKGRTLKPGP